VEQKPKRQKKDPKPSIRVLKLLNSEVINHDKERLCPCATAKDGVACPSLFEDWEILRVRTERSKLFFHEQLARRRADIRDGYILSRQPSISTPEILNRKVCLKGYCIIMGWNYNAVCQTLKSIRLLNRQPRIGRPRGCDTEALSLRGEICETWIRDWIEMTGDQDPTGERCSYSINFITASDLYEKYKFEMSLYSTLKEFPVVSLRTFTRKFTAVRIDMRVRVRKKIHVSTKCSG
jgi:hypothetical protein